MESSVAKLVTVQETAQVQSHAFLQLGSHGVAHEESALLRVAVGSPPLWPEGQVSSAATKILFGGVIIILVLRVWCRVLAASEWDSETCRAGGVFSRLEWRTGLGNGHVGLKKFADGKASGVDRFCLFEHGTDSMLGVRL